MTTRTNGSADHVDAYFICGTPRTGSSLLLGLLDSTGIAGRPQAYFREPDVPLWAERWGVPRTPDGRCAYGDFVRAAIDAGRTGNGVFGAKLMWGTLDDLVAGLEDTHPDLAGQDTALLERSFGRTAFVHLTRDDALAQAVSWLRAEQTGVWYLGGSGEIGDARPSGRPASFEPDRIDELVRTIGEHNAAWQAWFATWGIRPHRVRYEDLTADMTGVTLGILDFLGLALPEGGTVLPRHRRQADALNASWIDRIRAEQTGPAHAPLGPVQDTCGPVQDTREPAARPVPGGTPPPASESSQPPAPES